MKTTDFSRYLQKFFTEFMPGVNGNSPATVDSYRYAFIHFLDFMSKVRKIEATKLTIADFNYRNVVDFYDWLERECGNSVATRKVRQAAINSFAKFLVYEYPDYMSEYQRIMAIPSKKAPTKEISYVKAEGMESFLEQINVDTESGYRNYVMMSLLFTTGIRVSELIEIRVKDVMLQEPPTLLIHGKGNKSRYVPLVKQIVAILKDYLSRKDLFRPERYEDYLFLNHMKKPFTRQGVNYIVNKYKEAANQQIAHSIPDDFSPHKIRHSSAMMLLDAGVDLIYIRDFLGHVSVQTTEIYAKAETQKKREAIEAASKEIVKKEPALWDDDADLRAWLNGFNRKS